MSFDVAITKTGVFFSCSHVMKVPNTRAVVPASEISDDDIPDNPFSISSSHNMHGATLSAVLIARLIFSSDEPINPLNKVPRSSLNKGSSQSELTAFAVRDFPHP